MTIFVTFSDLYYSFFDVLCSISYFFRAHFRQMRQMNSMMSSMFSDPFGMMGDMGGMGGMGGLGAIGGMGGMGGMGGPLSIMAPHHHPRNAMMPFMPPHMNMNRLLTGLSYHF